MFIARVVSVLRVASRGTFVGIVIEEGAVHVGDRVRIKIIGGTTREVNVRGVEIMDGRTPDGKRESIVALHLDHVQASEIEMASRIKTVP